MLFVLVTLKVLYTFAKYQTSIVIGVACDDVVVLTVSCLSEADLEMWSAKGLVSLP